MTRQYKPECYLFNLFRMLLLLLLLLFLLLSHKENFLSSLLGRRQNVDFVLSFKARLLHNTFSSIESWTRHKNFIDDANYSLEDTPNHKNKERIFLSCRCRCHRQLIHLTLAANIIIELHVQQKLSSLSQLLKKKITSWVPLHRIQTSARALSQRHTFLPTHFCYAYSSMDL